MNKVPKIDDHSLNKAVDAKLEDLIAPHIDSFNFFLEEGINLAIPHIDKVEYHNKTEKARWWIEEVTIGFPSPLDNSSERLFPSECREGGFTYGSRASATICYQQRGYPVVKFDKKLGYLPIMVKSTKCRLANMNQQQLVSHSEEPNELGGYFIINGLEKIIRMLIVPRRNDSIAVIRPSFNRIGSSYSQYATIIRCVRNDQTSQTITLHYLTDGNCNVRFILGRQEFFVPVIVLMKALIETTDKEIFDKVVQRDRNDTFIMDNIELLLRETKKLNIFTQTQALIYIGSRFRIALREISAEYTDKQVGEHLLKKYILVHLHSNQDKFELLIFMLQQLYALVHGDIQPDNPDSPMNQEVLLAGHLYLMFFKEKLQEMLYNTRINLMKLLSNKKNSLDEILFKKALDRTPEVGEKVKYFLSTGNIISETGLDLMQASGFCIIAEKLNFLRYLSHFRCIHRGAFFAEMKTTTVRKLLPEAWGFLCPVHTPDGAPCGLLNHLTRTCQVTVDNDTFLELPSLLVSLGVSPITSSVVYPKDYLTVFLDGRIIGKLKPDLANHLITNLRFLKVKKLRNVPSQLEIAFVPPSQGGRFPGLFLFTTPARMMRPVKYLPTGDIELIGTFEQVYLSVACLSEDIKPDITTHQELDPTNFLSVVANMTPFSDFNQSPRNMYQCQMGKQSLATPCHSYVHRVDNKIYRLQTPQKPIVRTSGQMEYPMNDYPTGANAIVAVISYTGYDMEDAMIINKSSYERGWAHASVYKSEEIILQNSRARINDPIQYFHNIKPTGELVYENLDPDGLPSPGTRLRKGDLYYCIFDETTGEHKPTYYKNNEECYVDEVRIIVGSTKKIDHVNIKLRFNRNPVIGDKFSSRHGQKGILSRLWPQIDMPFSESGLTPDLIINPHAFPSRMTIGMLVESLAGKSGALHGIFQDATPFRFDEKNTAVDYFGEQLVKAGFNYYGNEPMYSGVSGVEFKADIYLGVVYYQRLRHMVKDKYQVRSTGPINQLTHQPIKGRKVGGGIRFGEMERDSLLAHGASFFLHDRLMNCSDSSKAYLCRHCGGILSPATKLSNENRGIGSSYPATCLYCETSSGIEVIYLPYVFKYLCMELAAMNIKMTLFVE